MKKFARLIRIVKAGKFLVLIAATVFVALNLSVKAQEIEMPNTVPPPSAEKFESFSRRLVYYKPSNIEALIRLYNEDGTVWYEFSHLRESPLFYLKNTKSDYRPYTTFGGKHSILTVKAKSKNWYKVVVNEETRDTKYALITDPEGTIDTWESSFSFPSEVQFDVEKNPLRETPNGKVKTEEISATDRFLQVNTQLSGNWLEVEKISSGIRVKGWIRWRDEDDNILVLRWSGHGRYYDKP